MLIILNLGVTFLVPGISIGGHVGGLLGGAIAAYVLYGLDGRVRLSPPVATALAAAVGVLAVVGSIALVPT